MYSRVAEGLAMSGFRCGSEICAAGCARETMGKRIALLLGSVGASDVRTDCRV